MSILCALKSAFHYKITNYNCIIYLFIIFIKCLNGVILWYFPLNFAVHYRSPKISAVLWTEQTEQKTKLTGRWEKCITGSRGDPNWCVGWIMHLSQSFQSCNFAKWQWSKLSLEGMVLRERLKWLRECKREHQKGREDISVSCQILSWLVLHLHFPSLSLSSYPGNTNRFDNSVWKQLPQRKAAAIKEAHCCVLRSDVYTGINPPVS